MSDANQAEWLCVQQSYDKMEQQALWLKVVTLVLWFWLIESESTLILQLGLIGLFWLHEAIWKTQQSRALTRLLQLEQAIREGKNSGCQWQSCWQAERSGPFGLVLDYLRHAVKPTVAITYVVLLIASFIRFYF